MDLNKIIQEKIDAYIVNELGASVEKKVSGMLDEILKDIFKTWSDTGKEIKAKIEAGLEVNLQRYDLVDYNVLVANAINKELVNIVNNQSIEPILELVKGAVGFVNRKNMKLSEIHKMVKDISMSDDETEMEGEITFLVESDMFSSNDTTAVYIDLEKNKDKRDCSIEFYIHQKTQRIYSFQFENYWHKKFSELTHKKIQSMDKLEKIIYRLYAASVQIEIDETDFEYENSWSRYN